ncbi:MAG: Bug family tripartite tricarboxylate transporter substrate binding protein [Burkholderiales bacterium]
MLARIGLSLLLLCLVCGTATAQNFPNRPIRIIVPFAAGGPTDTHSRWGAQHLTTALGQQVIIDNRGGAGGVIGTEAVAKAPADGYTLLGGNPGPLTIAPSVRKQLNYDTNRDFAPITLIVRSASCMCIHPSIPVKNLREFIALAKNSPGKINYATPGLGTVGHLGTELFTTSVGIRMNMIPYKGAALYVVDLMAGNVDFAYVQIAQSAPLVKAGKLRPLAVTATERTPLLPDTPTAAEQGVKGFSSYNWTGLLAPAGTPKAIIDRMHGILHKPLADPATRKRLTDQGNEVAGDGPAEYAAFIKSEIDKWGRVARIAGIPKQ